MRTKALPTPEELLPYVVSERDPAWRYVQSRQNALRRGDWLTALLVLGLVFCIVEPNANGAIKKSPLGQFFRRVPVQVQQAKALPARPQNKTQNKKAVIANAAKQWIGKDFRKGRTAQCMFFVRHVLSQVGLNPPVTKYPSDAWAKQPNAPGMARSLFGKDIGTLITDKSQLEPGDLIAFYDTYQYGNCRRGSRCITHVGIYIGNGMMVDRPTASKPVQLRSIDIFQFAVAVRLGG